MGLVASPTYLLAVVVLAFGGIPKGYDEGGFSASVTLPAFKNDYGLNKSLWIHNATGLANRTVNITSFGVLGAAIGALIAFFLNDKIGRLWSYRVAILMWASGILMQVFSSGIFGFLLFARVWGGFGAGGLTVIAPLFLSEIAPTKSRGIVVSRHEECITAIARLRGLSRDDPALVDEHEKIELEAIVLVEMTSASIIDTAKDCFTIWSLRSRYLLTISMHIVAQWTGGNGITYYISDIFQYAGVKGSQTSLITSGAYGIVKLVITMIFAWGLIDRIGRRRCFLAGLTLQGATHIYMAVYFGAIGSTNRHASDAAIASVFVFATGWSIGLCTIPYIYGAEIFPTKNRSFAYATTMSLHWFCQFAVVRVTPVMLAALNKWGAYLVWAIICAVGIVVLGLWAPETKGVPLECMSKLFDPPWYKCWRSKVDTADVYQSTFEEKGFEKGSIEQRKVEARS
ncbi:putative MFS quinate transporter [Setomelanomma holmii]|uniref:MFS quinate transporter n=1 Tax=Setomelanomma holmii TaxID=210430 RepID=A0A9P4HKZ2_9PLEO|nr:putative MFS quinate transporter [Setomelanomma holmii]